MLPLGTKAPDFKLLDTQDGKEKTLNELKSDEVTVIVFICNHCPFVRHIRTTLGTIANKYQGEGIAFIGISSNDAEAYPEDAPDEMTIEGHQYYNFPYLYDETQEVAKAYHAACTPDFFIFDRDMKCIYRGRFDSSRPDNNKPVTGEDLIKALDSYFTDGTILEDQKPSVGCSIKWKE
jgi:peroxiredoxin